MFPVIISDNQRVSSENMSCSNPLCANYDRAQDGFQGRERESCLIKFHNDENSSYTIQRKCFSLVISDSSIIGESSSVSTFQETGAGDQPTSTSTGQRWDPLIITLQNISQGISEDLQTKQIKQRFGRQKLWNVRLVFLLSSKEYLSISTLGLETLELCLLSACNYDGLIQIVLDNSHLPVIIADLSRIDTLWYRQDTI